MTKEKKETTELQETKKETTELAPVANNAVLDVSSFSGASVADMVPSSIVLVQGDNPIKEELGVKNGNFVADNMSFGTEFLFQPISSQALFDVFSTDPTIPNTKPTFVKSMIEPDVVLTDEGIPVDLAPIGEGYFPLVFEGSDGLFYQRKKVLIGAINGLPYRLVFKSQAKHMAFKDIYQIMVKATKHNELADPIEGIFKIFSKEMTSKTNKKFYTMSCGFVRKATEEELAEVAPFRTIDITKVKESEISDQPF